MPTQKTSYSIRSDIELLSSQYLGKPYIENPLNDSDRRIRYDGFDCVTYVETVLAFSRKASEKNILGVMDQIRYKDGNVGFVRRHHIVEQTWIPENIKKGLVKDVTTRYAQQMQIELHHAESIADPKGFYEKCHFDELKKEYKIESREEWDALLEKMTQENELPECLKASATSCPYLSIQDLLQNPEKLRLLETGTILWIVRPNWNMKAETGTDLVISHLGFVIRAYDGQARFRHATSVDPRQVVDVLLEDYLAQYKDPSQTTVRGIRLLDVCPDQEMTESPALKGKIMHSIKSTLNPPDWYELFYQSRESLEKFQDVIQKDKTDYPYVIEATIHIFANTFELYWKMLKKICYQEGIEVQSPRATFQQSFALKLIDDETVWLKMMENRNLTSHTYKQPTANMIYDECKTYLPIMMKSYTSLQQKYHI